MAFPNTYVNDTGKAIEALSTLSSFRPETTVLIYDDLDLPFGKVRVRRFGSAAGHRGIMSIFQAAGTTHFPRIRIGIGRPNSKEEIQRYVLSPFSAEERKHLPALVDLVFQIALAFWWQDDDVYRTFTYLPPG